MTQTPSQVPPPPAPRKRRFGCLSIVLTLLTLIILAVAVAIWMAKSEPAEWLEVNKMIADATPEEKSQRAESLEKRFVGESQGIDTKTGPVITPGFDPSAPTERDISISVADANIWLATRLEKTLANQNSAMPKAIADPRVWIEDGQVVLSAKVELPGANINGVISVALEASMQPDGQMAMKVAKVRAGKLPLPSGVVADQLREEFKNAEANAVQMIGKAFDGMTIDPVFPDAGDKSRETRILDFKIHPDRVDLKLRNTKKGTPANVKNP